MRTMARRVRRVSDAAAAREATPNRSAMRTDGRRHHRARGEAGAEGGGDEERDRRRERDMGKGPGARAPGPYGCDSRT